MSLNLLNYYDRGSEFYSWFLSTIKMPIECLDEEWFYELYINVVQAFKLNINCLVFGIYVVNAWQIKLQKWRFICQERLHEKFTVSDGLKVAEIPMWVTTWQLIEKYWIRPKNIKMQSIIKEYF